jgi:hypothetical protein
LKIFDKITVSKTRNFKCFKFKFKFSQNINHLLPAPQFPLPDDASTLVILLFGGFLNILKLLKLVSLIC